MSLRVEKWITGLVCGCLRRKCWPAGIDIWGRHNNGSSSARKNADWNQMLPLAENCCCWIEESLLGIKMKTNKKGEVPSAFWNLAFPFLHPYGQSLTGWSWQGRDVVLSPSPSTTKESWVWLKAQFSNREICSEFSGKTCYLGILFGSLSTMKSYTPFMTMICLSY